MNCKNCNGNSFVEVPDFEKMFTVCTACGEVQYIKYVDVAKLKKYQKSEEFK